jgi:hypothetical protein
MKEKLVRNIGHIHYNSNLYNGTGMRITNDLLSSIVEGFVRNTGKYILNTGEAPFAYKEKQLHSLIIPVMHNICDAVLSEAPIDRKWSSIVKEEAFNSHGWVDYWCYYRNLSFWIELKHSFISSRTGKITKRTLKEWNDAIDQLDVIQEDTVSQSKWCKGSIRVALLVLPIYESYNKKESDTIGNKEIMRGILENLIEQFGDKPNWSSVWTLHKNLVGPYEYIDREEIYPGVIVLAKVYNFSK